MKLLWLLLLAVTLLQLIPNSNQEEHGLRLPEGALMKEVQRFESSAKEDIAVSGDDEGDRIAAFDAQKDDGPVGAEDEEPARRVRGRTVKRRRRLRKRLRTTTEPPLEELNEQLDAAQQQHSEDQLPAEPQPEEQPAPVELPSLPERNGDVSYEQARISEDATALPPLEETTRRRPGKRRRRPHKKQPHDGTSESPEDGSAETQKPPRRRRKGGRRRPRPTVQPTEPNKVELYIETTMMPPEAPEISTPAYTVESASKPPPPRPSSTYIVESATQPPPRPPPSYIVESATQPPPQPPPSYIVESATQPPPRSPPSYTVKSATQPPPRPPPQIPESPDHTLTVLKDDNTPLYRIYDSRHNLVLQPSVNQVVDGSSQHFPEPSRIPDTSLFQEPSRLPTKPKQESEIPTKYTETRFPQEQSIPDFQDEFPAKSPGGPKFPDQPKSTVVLEYPEPTRFKEQQFPQPSRIPDTRHQIDSSFRKSQKPAPVYEEPVQYSQVSTFPDTKKYTEPQKYHERDHSNPLLHPEVLEIETAQGYSTSSNTQPKPYSARPAANIIKPVQELIQETDPEPSEHHEERVEKESNEVPSQAPTETISSRPAPDRKALFTKSRKLPETSAGLRKKLIPRYQRGQQENTKSTEAPEKMVPDGYTVPPQTVEPSKLIEKLKQHAKSYRTTTVMIPSTMITTEEPNYPKFESKKKNSVTENIVKTTTETMRFNKVVELHRSRGKVVITTTQAPQFEIPQTTDIEKVDESDTTEPGKVIVDKLPEEQTSTSEKTDSKDVDLDKLNDSIVELLQSESGNMKLSEILESRNMTLAQLLEHREKGSRHFHLVDIFSKTKTIIGENTTDSMNADKAEATPISLDRQTIPFPSQDVLGSFPAFISDKVVNGVQTKDGMNETTTRRSVHLENRVPRVFESMPEFKKTVDTPPWKVPNPRLRPVNVRGDIEEIKISQYPPENPKSENDIDHAFLLDDKGDLLRTNRATLEAESHSNETAFGRFKRIPVTVKSAIIISVAILMLAIFGFLSVLISCRLRQKKARLRVKQDILCEHLKNEDFMNSQQSLSPVLTKQQGRAPPSFTQNNAQSNTATNRQYYLWRTLRKTFQYD